jgi:hypothetical protein
VCQRRRQRRQHQRDQGGPAGAAIELGHARHGRECSGGPLPRTLSSIKTNPGLRRARKLAAGFSWQPVTR